MWLKIALLVSFAVLVKSVPLKQLQEPAKSTIDDGDIQSPFFLFNARNPLQIGKFAIADDSISYRLPNNSIPVRYDLWLKTDVHAADFQFSGRVKIHLKITSPTKQITLHHRQLTILNIDLVNVDESLIQTNLAHDYDDVVEFLTIDLPAELPAEREVVLDITYLGTLREDGSGFYRANYSRNDEVGNTVWYATTQFEMTDARHAMPCYDEPGLRAITGLAIQHHKSYEAISNMPIASRISVGVTDYVTSTFQDTLPMQSYLLAFIISDFKYVSNDNVKTEQRIYAKPQSIDRGEADFASTVVDPILRGLEDHFGLPYPLPKMDHAAITNYIWGAMENFGLITYQEAALIYDPSKEPASREKSLIQLIAHEYTHQWFGDIVNPKWWSYTWMNEGFATLYSYYVPDIIYPELGYMDSFLDSALGTAFRADVGDSKPLNFYVETPTDIRNKFDSISYQKGGCVLRMFQEALTVPTFTKGLNYYLTKMQFSPATPQDLHEALQKAFDEEFMESGLDIHQAMSTWEDQAGYPNIRVQKSGSKITLIQSRFGGGDELYTVPISYATKSEPTFNVKTPVFWLSTVIGIINLDDVDADGWFILNVQLTGYYKVSYDRSAWSAIAKGLQDDQEVIPTLHKVQLFKDVSPLLQDLNVDGVDGLRMLSFLSEENSSAVWVQVLQTEAVLSRFLFGTSALVKYQEFIGKVVDPHLRRLGFEAIAGESSADASLRDSVTTISCRVLQEDCLIHERHRLESFVETGEGAFDLCNGIRLASQEVHAHFLNEVISGKSPDFLNHLGCSLNEDILKSFLQLVLDSTKSLSADQRAKIITETMGKSVLALELILNFLADNLVAIETIIPRALATIVESMTAYINSDEHFESLQNVLSKMLEESIMTPAELINIRIKAYENLQWNEMNFKEVNKFFNGDVTTAAQTTSTTPAPTTESTTLGSGSLIASFTVIVSFALIKLFL